MGLGMGMGRRSGGMKGKGPVEGDQGDESDDSGSDVGDGVMGRGELMGAQRSGRGKTVFGIGDEEGSPDFTC
jgi:hypothetical protein